MYLVKKVVMEMEKMGALQGLLVLALIWNCARGTCWENKGSASIILLPHNEGSLISTRDRNWDKKIEHILELNTQK